MFCKNSTRKKLLIYSVPEIFSYIKFFRSNVFGLKFLSSASKKNKVKVPKIPKIRSLQYWIFPLRPWMLSVPYSIDEYTGPQLKFLFRLFFPFRKYILSKKIS